MRILLPPSEGKTPPAAGPPVDLAGFGVPVPGRDTVLDALVSLCRAEPERAVSLLKLSKGQAAEVTRDAALPTAPAAPAGQVYSGVLFDAFGLAALPEPARTVAAESVWIFSGLWGVVRPDDLIPAYRCPGTATLPGLGDERPMSVTRFWRDRLAAVLDPLVADELVVDLRSYTYVAMWRPRRAVAIRVLHEREVAGERVRTVVSHFNKATKGRLAARLVTEGVVCRDVAELTVALKDLGYRVERHPSGALDIIVEEL
ncbi:hypothetical protein LX16_0438 [Stackebrandtia albiflava]|uniref:Peroxide stress protein YaaA n=1 Tax=Stackebrandtia albiflava TaxID=406432 RepID=A0A562VA33_9ACTN|nr:peroxide stress protein YaaA [Stackebrandtia albiflava]TWJ14749.1 hypothetical protein LX16_0438 [Stackebrandtia albiflava]